MEEELPLSFGKLSVGESDSREEQSEDYESQHDPNDSDSNGKCNLIVNYLPHDVDDISLKVKVSLYLMYIYSVTDDILCFTEFICRIWRDCHD